MEARILHQAAIGAVLLGDRDADVIPCDVAARRFRGADEPAADGIAATA